MAVSKNKAVKRYRAGNITAAFGADLLVTGSTGVPNLLLKYYTKLDITDNEMMLLIQLLRLRLEEKNLCPTPEDFDEVINGGAEQFRYLTESLLEKDLLGVTEYYDFEQDMVIKGFDFEPLFEKLSELWACDKVKEIEQTKNILDSSNHSSTSGLANINAQKSTLKEDQPSGQVLNICTLFEREFARPLSPMEVERIRHWLDEMDSVLIMEALRRAVMLGKNNFRYIEAILMEWRKNNLRTLQDIEKYDEDFKMRRARRGYNTGKNEDKVGTQVDKKRKKLYDALLMS